MVFTSASGKFIEQVAKQAETHSANRASAR